MATLKALSDIISTGVFQITSACAACGDVYPTLDDPYTVESNNIQNRYAIDAAPVIAAAYQLIATLSNPEPYIFTWGMSSYFSASLAAAGQGCVPDILTEVGSDGMHVEEIARKNDMDADKLGATYGGNRDSTTHDPLAGRILRLLASRNIFAETASNRFRNNRISSALCTGKTPEAMQARPAEKWDNTNGCSAMTEFLGTDAARAAGMLVDNLTDPATAHSRGPNRAPIQRAFKTDLPFHYWLQEPANIIHMKRLQHGMRTLTAYASEDLPTGGFDWAGLPENQLVVDVGGGIGTVSMDIAEKHKHLRYMIQDLPATVEEGRAYWASVKPEMLDSGQVQFQVHNFFEPQPVTNAAVFMVRYILHNWPDTYAVTILKQLRAAAQPDTTLVVLDQILDYMSRDGDTGEADIPGAKRPVAPEPLCPYPDAVSGYGYLVDLLMMGCLNSKGRTVTEFRSILNEGGWELRRVHRFAAPHPQQLVCTPLPQSISSKL
ncbi:hypothetical protein NM688_g3629 [Phlebia brevispora]|uniref:Uncharacterized protein n=1 Tax=Phlebia brevispora TaxID=194682 RepID=A0ACC1T506_9APHY|nr:hypothetical protein NM688_g3629 [Phlebia brevispora]